MDYQNNSTASSDISINLWSPIPGTNCLASVPFLVALYSITTIPSIVINATLLWLLLIRIQPQTDNRYIFLKSLTVADLFISIVGQPSTMTVVLQLHRTDTVSVINLHRLVFYMNCVTCAASSSSLMFLCIQRYIHIAYPFKHESILTKKRLRVAVGVIWLSAVTGSMVPWIKHMGGTIFYIVILIALITVFAVMAVIQLLTVKIVRNLIEPAGITAGSQLNKESSRKIICTSFINVTIFVLSWFPFAITGYLFYSKYPSKSWEKSSVIRDCTSSVIQYTKAFLYTIYFAQLSSVLNPIIHSTRDTHIKQAIHRSILLPLALRFNLKWFRNQRDNNIEASGVTANSPEIGPTGLTSRTEI